MPTKEAKGYRETYSAHVQLVLGLPPPSLVIVRDAHVQPKYNRKYMDSVWQKIFWVQNNIYNRVYSPSEIRWLSLSTTPANFHLIIKYATKSVRKDNQWKKKNTNID